LLLFEPVPLRTKCINVVQHPIEQRFGGNGWNAGLLKLPDLAALAMDLSAHTLNFGPNVFYIRHGEAASYSVGRPTAAIAKL
jgi:hypothetical protein